jgi:hypothetical protein
MGTSVSLRVAAFALHLSVVAIVVGATFPISLRAFPGRPVASLLFIDLVGCAVAPVLFWLLMSTQGVLTVTAVGVGTYGIVAAILARRVPP